MVLPVPGRNIVGSHKPLSLFMKKIGCILSLLGLFIPITLLGQSVSISVSHLGDKAGLSHSVVHCLTKGKTDFVWAGTQDGLNRFDGYSFSTFNKDKIKVGGLSNNYTWEVYPDSKGNLWVGMNGGGLCKYDPRFSIFESFILMD